MEKTKYRNGNAGGAEANLKKGKSKNLTKQMFRPHHLQLATKTINLPLKADVSLENQHRIPSLN